LRPAFIYLNAVARPASGRVQRTPTKLAVMIGNGSIKTTSLVRTRTAKSERKMTMLNKFAGALLAATLLTAPAFAEGMSKNTAPAAAAQSGKAELKTEFKAPAKANVKAVSTVKTLKGKHARKHHRMHIAKHGKSVKVVKATKVVKVKHLKVSKRNHIRTGTQASSKALTKTGTN
jgi:hypothetical protein